VIVEAHGIRVTLASGWSGRVFQRSSDVATLHAGDFPLVLSDGEFGDASTARMPGHATFLALTEYRPGRGLRPGHGLFAGHKLPLPLDPASFSATGLAHPRPGQLGMQHFFTRAGRPFCLYVVIAGPRLQRRERLLRLDAILHTLHISPRE
jgi:hypothetical protein